MNNSEIERIWREIEDKTCQSKVNMPLQRMICIELLYRVYIGSYGLPSKRYVSIEIPETETNQFDAFSVPKGFTLSIAKPSVKHDGFCACVLEAATHDLNDVFSIVVIDVLDELRKQKESVAYIATLRNRINKWRDFFKNPSTKKLSEKMVIGLFGELTLLYSLLKSGITNAIDIWNGPIKSAQDFQGKSVAIEVKTTVSTQIESAHISSEVQLDSLDYSALFLATLRIECDDLNGVTLPQLVEKIGSELNGQQAKRFYAALLCLGYNPEYARLYTKHYTLKEEKYYEVSDGFPRLLRGNIPKGIHDIKYCISLGNCNTYLVEWDKVVSTIREYEYG